MYCIVSKADKNTDHPKFHDIIVLNKNCYVWVVICQIMFTILVNQFCMAQVFIYCQNRHSILFCFYIPNIHVNSSDPTKKRLQS